MGTRVFIGRLPRGCRERDIEDYFRKCGRIRDVIMKRGYAFVDFDDDRDAEDAVYEMNGKTMMGERMTVEMASGRPRGRDRGDRGGAGGGAGGGGARRRGGFGPPQRSDYQITIDNLSSRISWQDLKDIMKEQVDVVYADAHKVRKNHAVVEFKTYDDLKRAVDKFDGKELNGRKIEIRVTKKGRKSRTRSRSNSRRSRSRSNSRKRSPSRSRSRSRSRSPTPKKGRMESKSRSRSRSKSPAKNGDGDKDRERSISRDRQRRDASRSRSRSRTPRSRSRSAGRSAGSRSRSRSAE